MLQIGDVLIRPARESDAPEIANVHLNSWREAYRNLLPQDYLDQLPTTFRQRMINWERSLRETDQIVFVAESKCGLVGFSRFQNARDTRFHGYHELSAIYLFEKWQGKGVGQALLQFGMNEAVGAGALKVYCWVLNGNPTIDFYARSGAKFSGIVKTDEIGGFACEDLAYVWETLECFKITRPNSVRFDTEKMSHLIPEVTSLLHRAYGPLAARGMKYTASHQPPERTLERLTEGESYLQFLGSKVTGTISLVPTKTQNDCEHYNKPGVFSFHQFAIDPQIQGRGYGSELLTLVEKRARELGATELALDTSEHADNLIAMYEKRGYDFVQHVRWGSVNYRSVVMSKKLDNSLR